MSRLYLLAKRFLTAYKLGFFFLGTRSFKCPKNVTVGRIRVDLIVPVANKGVHTDFMNILIDDEYKLNSLDKCVTILDVGANIGTFSLWARMRFPDARIIAVEPNPFAFKFLNHNSAKLGIELHPIALGLSDGAVEVESDDDITCCTVRVVSGGSVQMRRLCDFIKDTVGGEIDLLKMDCEGFEWELFKDVEAFKQVKRIHMEYHLTEERSLSEFKTLVANAGFTIAQIVENNGFGMCYLVR